MNVRCAHTEMVDVDLLVPHPLNPNKHGEKQIEMLAKIMKHQGWRHPITVSKRSGFIVAGHGRLMAAKKLGWTSAPIDRQEFETEADEYAHLIADNKIAELADHDDAKMFEDLKAFPDLDLDLLGIPDLEIPAVELIPQCDPDDVPDALPEPKVVRGEVYLLGRHRLMCGDSTVITDVERLMNGEKADLWLTDAPYGVSYADKNEFLNSLGNGIRLTKRIENDHMSLDDSAEFWFQVASCAFSFCSNKAAYYWFACQGGDQMMMMMMQSLGRAAWKVRHELIWVKNNHVLGRCDYQYKHEPILYGWKKDGTHNFYGGFQTSVIEFPKPQANKLHPTMKPVELFELLMNNSTKQGELVLETFGGSGTSVIAAEKTSRKCYAIEIDPHYCGVILDRWQKFTGQKATREDGKLWDEIRGA